MRRTVVADVVAQRSRGRAQADRAPIALERKRNRPPSIPAFQGDRSGNGVDRDPLRQRLPEGHDRSDHAPADEPGGIGGAHDVPVQHDRHRRRGHEYVPDVTQAIAILRAAGKRFSEDGCAFMAQAIAFNAMFAVFPLLMLAFAAFGFIYGGEAGEARIRDLISHLAPTVQPLLFENAQHIVAFRSVSGVTAVIGLIWSGKNLFQTLAFSLDRALGVPKSRSLVFDIVVALIALPVIGIILLAATAVPVGISYVVTAGGLKHGTFLTQAAGYAAGIFLVFVVTMLLYAYLPNRRVSPWFGVPGAIVTTIAWEVSQIAFAIYSTHVDFRHVYGALATVAVLLLWFYYMAFIFLFGAQVSAQTLELRHPGAQPVRRTA